MAQIFPRWTNRLPFIITAGFLFTIVLIVFLIWYYFSPWNTDVGYQPEQPVPYSHKLHAGDLGIDCRYCHTTVEFAATASVPSTQICMNCHKLIKPESMKLLPVRESWASGLGIQWVRVHKIPDYAYFDHSIHIRAGVGCVSCHGRVDEMETVKLVKPLSMSWCLDCHRDPDPHLRFPESVTDMEWTPPADHAAWVEEHKSKLKIEPSEDCSICHR